MFKENRFGKIKNITGDEDKVVNQRKLSYRIFRLSVCMAGQSYAVYCGEIAKQGAYIIDITA